MHLDHDVADAADRRSRRPTPNRPCHSLEPRNTAARRPRPAGHSDSRPTVRRRRRLRTARARSVRLIRRRGGRPPPAAARAAAVAVARRPRSLSHRRLRRIRLAGVRSAHGPPLVQPGLQDRRPPPPDRSSRFCPLARTPASRSERWAVTVVSRSSASRTGTGAIRAASAIGQLDGVLRRRPGAIGQGARQPDDHLDRARVRRPARQPAQVPVGVRRDPGHRLHRRRQDARRGRWSPRRYARCRRRCRAVGRVRGPGPIRVPGRSGPRSSQRVVGRPPS